MEKKEMDIFCDKYIVIECENEGIEMYQVKSFYYQNIPGVRVFRYSMSQNKSFLYFENTYAQSLNEYAAGEVSVEKIYRMLMQIKVILEDADNYLLYQENYCFHPDFIKVNEYNDVQNIELLYLPLKEGCNDKYKEYLCNFLSVITRLFNKAEDMEGFYYFVRMLEEVREGEMELSFLEHLNMFLDMPESRKRKKSMLI